MVGVGKDNLVVYDHGIQIIFGRTDKGTNCFTIIVNHVFGIGGDSSSRDVVGTAIMTGSNKKVVAISEKEGLPRIEVGKPVDSNRARPISLKVSKIENRCERNSLTKPNFTVDY